MFDDMSPGRMSAGDHEFSFTIDGFPGDTFQVAEFTATEALSQPFSLDLLLMCADPRVPLGKAVGKSAVFTSESVLGERYFHGIVAEIQMAGRGRTLVRYRVRVVPRLWLLSRRRDSRIFQAMSTPDVLKEVFAGAGISGDGLDLRLNRSYQPRDYCVQYRETDLAFVSRLMEEEGITYFFAHSAGGHKLVLSDDAIAHEELDPPTLRFLPSGMSGGAGQHIESLALARTIQPGKATLRDFNFKGPSESLEVSVEYDGTGASIDEIPGDNNTDLEFYDFPGEYVDKSLGSELARLRLEQLQVERFRVDGESTARRLCPGFLGAVLGHARLGMNRPYLITSVTHRGTQPVPDTPDDDRGESTYRNRFTAIPAELSFRPALNTPRPVVSGLQTAIVTGPAGEEIHTDEFGRVKIQFHWDRQGQRDDQSSCWVRVSHPSAGAGYGQIILPRVGQEVIIQFLEGDPDRPIVTGRLYNGEQTPPSPLPDGKTRSSIKSNTYPGGGGYNEFTFEDKAGAEQIVLHGQKDANFTINNDQSTSIGNNESHSVAASRSKSVGGDESASVGGNRTASVTGNEDLSVEKNQTLKVTLDRTVTVSGNETRTITLDEKETINGGRTTSVTKDDKLTVTGKSSTTVLGGEAKVEVTGTYDLSASADIKEHATVNLQLQGDSTAKMTSPAVTVRGDNSVLIESGTKVTIKVGGSTIDLTSSEIAIKSTTIKLNAGTVEIGDGTINITGGTVNVNGGSITSAASGVHTIQGLLVKVN